MQATMRPYGGDDDHGRIRGFLRDAFLRNDRREWSWQAYRFDYWRWHGAENIMHVRLEDVVSLWETADGRIAAVLNPEDPGNAFLHVDPELRTRALEEEIIAAAERRLVVPAKEGGWRLRVWAHERDSLRPGILKRRGYARSGMSEFQRHRTLDASIPDAPIAKGYAVRALGGDSELPARSWASWKAFHPDEPDEKYEGWEWYRNVQRAPLYRRDLDLVAVAPDGSIASFTTVWFDDVTRAGAFEPVGTAKEHRRRGLAKAVLCEGLRRLRRLGAVTAHVGSYEPTVHALYASVGFTEYDVSEPWARTI